jgi:hypothetical protein
MKIKALKSFQSSIVNMDEGEIKDVELDEYTFENWTANGFIQEVKEDSEPDAAAQDTGVGNEAPEAVNTDEN